jgi:hypothetical protein
METVNLRYANTRPIQSATMCSVILVHLPQPSLSSDLQKLPERNVLSVYKGAPVFASYLAAPHDEQSAPPLLQ